jgi:hypothetical protein
MGSHRARNRRCRSCPFWPARWKLLCDQGADGRFDSGGDWMDAPGVKPKVPHAGLGTGVEQLAPDASEGTFDIPVTPEVSAIVARDGARQTRMLAIAVAGAIAFGQLLGLGLYLWNSPREFWVYLLGAGIGALSALMIGIVGVVIGALARRDRRELTYLRTTGPVRLDSIQGGFILRLADRSFIVDSKRVAPALRDLDWASIDYSRHAHVVLAVRNRGGVDVYCVDGYRRPLPFGSNDINAPSCLSIARG